MHVVPQLLPDPEPLWIHQASGRNTPISCLEELCFIPLRAPWNAGQGMAVGAASSVTGRALPCRCHVGSVQHWLKTETERESMSLLISALKSCCAEGHVNVAHSPHPLGEVWCVLEIQNLR